MNRFLSLLTLLFWVTSLIAQPPNHNYVTPWGEEEQFELEFADEFNSDQLDHSKWKAVKGLPRDPYHQHQKHYFEPENIEVSNGTCKLWARRDTLLDKDWSIWIIDGMKNFNSDFYFTSAEINTKPLYGYGMYEIRCKLPKAKGMWPAFWVYEEPDGEYNELDVFEFWNQENLFGKVKDRRLSRKHHMSVHYDGKMSKKDYWGPDFSENFHTFTLYWDPNSIEWYVDGDLKRIQYRYKGMNKRKHDYQAFAEKRKKKGRKLKENLFPRDEGLMIIADLAVQSGEKAPDPDTSMPQALEIDYIRHYVRVD